MAVPSVPPHRVAVWRDRLIKARLFGIAYAPVVLIVSFRSLPDLRFAALYFVIFVALFLDAIRLVDGSRRLAARPATLSNVKSQGGAVSGYLGIYLLPFLAGGPDRFGEYAAYAVFFVIALLVFVRSDLALVNPTLYLLGWHVIEATDRGRRVLVLLREEPVEGATVRVVDLLDVYIVKNDARSEPSVRPDT